MPRRGNTCTEESDAGPAKRRRRRTSTDSESDFPASSQSFLDTIAAEASVGIIEKISVKNFMCHNRLDISFGAHVNFVIGRNGSGKSAILSALVLGLGGKAVVTSRGNTVKGFIKTGKQSGEIEIRLRNRGTDAYKLDEYGEVIAINRRFTADGSSTYKLKSKAGKVVSTKREELNHIVDHFNIQVDNPIAILNQDTSRSFLHSKSVHDKYKFFLKATQLEQMKSDYAAATEQMRSTAEIIEKKEQTLPLLEKEVLNWEQQLKNLTCVEDLKKKLNRLKHEMVWAIVQEKEDLLEPHIEELRREEGRLPRFEAKVTEAEYKLQHCEQRKAELNEQLKEVGEEVKEMEPTAEAGKKQVKEKKDEYRKAQIDLKRIEGELANIKKDRAHVLSDINDIRNTVTHDYEADRRARQDKIASLEEKLKSYEAQQQTTDNDLEQFRSAVQRHKQEANTLSEEQKSIRRSITEKTRYKESMLGARTNQLKRYGSWVPKALKMMEEEHLKGNFKHRPRGPVGACFKLKDISWALGMESCLKKSLLQSYCCDNHNDERVLEDIFQKVCREGERPAIIVRKFKNTVHNVTPYKAVSTSYPTALDMVDCDDPVILNCLIDQRSVENVLLIKNNDEARTVMLGSPPRNTVEAFTAKGDQLYCKPTFRYYSCEKNSASYLTADVDENISAVTAEIDGLNQQLVLLRRRAAEANSEIHGNQDQERRSSAQLMRINQAIHKTKTEIHELKRIEDPVPVDVTSLEEEAETYNVQIEKLEGQCEPKKTYLHNAKADLQKSEVELRKIERQILDLQEKGDPILDEMNAISHDLEKARHLKNHFGLKVKEQLKKIHDMKKKIDLYKKDLETTVDEAEQVCAERINGRRKPKDLDCEIKEISKRIEAEEKARGNAEEIGRKYLETRNAFFKIRREIQQLQLFVKCLKECFKTRLSRYDELKHSLSWRIKSNFQQYIFANHLEGKLTINHNSEELDIFRLEEVMKRRQTQYFELRRMIAMRIKYSFIMMLSRTQFTGKIVFDHDKKTLDMSVQPSNTETNNLSPESRDLRCLSGGERSFATVCFILSLWDAMESPFRCLDEFDVFMDMVNRRISMNMMMDVASSQIYRQFIFLTPLDMSQLNTTNNVRIFRMPDPDRTRGSSSRCNQDDDELMTQT